MEQRNIPNKRSTLLLQGITILSLAFALQGSDCLQRGVLAGQNLVKLTHPALQIQGLILRHERLSHS